jgi:hypothetical protein
MDRDTKKIDDAVLALLYLNSWTEDYGARDQKITATIAWKSLNRDALDRLHDAGLIANPRKKTKSVVLTQEGAARARAACERLFGGRG